MTSLSIAHVKTAVLSAVPHRFLQQRSSNVHDFQSDSQAVCLPLKSPPVHETVEHPVGVPNANDAANAHGLIRTAYTICSRMYIVDPDFDSQSRLDQRIQTRTRTMFRRQERYVLDSAPASIQSWLRDAPYRVAGSCDAQDFLVSIVCFSDTLRNQSNLNMTDTIAELGRICDYLKGIMFAVRTIIENAYRAYTQQAHIACSFKTCVNYVGTRLDINKAVPCMKDVAYQVDSALQSRSLVDFLGPTMTFKVTEPFQRLSKLVNVSLETPLLVARAKCLWHREMIEREIYFRSLQNYVTKHVHKSTSITTRVRALSEQLLTCCCFRWLCCCVVTQRDPAYTPTLQHEHD